MKKVIALVLALVLVLGLAACGTNGGNTTPANNAGGNTTPANNASGNTTPANNAGGNEAADVKWPDGPIDLFVPYDESSPTGINIGPLQAWIAEQTGVRCEPTYDKSGDGWKLAQDLLAAPADGQTLMIVGLDAITSYQNHVLGNSAGAWEADVTDPAQFTIVAGMIQPYPYVGCIIVTQADESYSTWEEFVKYVKDNAGKVNVADRAGSIMTTKLKSLFIQEGLYDLVHWTPASSSEVKTGIDPANNSIDIAIFEESQAVTYLEQSDKYKGLINCRPDNDYSYYAADTKGLDLIKAVPTFETVFGKEKAVQYNVPNTSAIICKAGTDPAVVAKIKATIDALGDVPESTDEKSFYVRQRVSGGSSKYYTWPSEDILKEWQRLAPLIKTILSTK